MMFSISSLDELFAAPFDDILDVRSPAEFAEDHIPGAVSLPVLSDDERTQVGTTYKQVSSFKARKDGAALVARNAANHIEGALSDRDGGWRPLVYCWRGGQRSGSFASILTQIGWHAEILDGGYRSYRSLVVALLNDSPLAHRLVLLDGNTGTAKTELLERLSERDVQTLDLEGLAAHRGSLFGAVGGSQPAQKSFESALAKVLVGFDPDRVIVVEAESSKVGNLQVPKSLWQAMLVAPRIRLSAPLDARARYLARAYADLIADRSVLHGILAELVKYHGHAQVKVWQELAAAEKFEALAGDLMQRHYDTRYEKSRMDREFELCAEVTFEDLDDSELNRAADRITALVSYLA